MTTDLTIREQQDSSLMQEFSVSDVLAQVNKIQSLMKSVLKEGEHFGTIPGCPKPSLYKPGAEKLGFTFRLMPRFQGEQQPRDLGNAHREYVITCELYHVPSGTFVGAGVGSCSTMEAKYRFRTGPKEFTGQGVPKEYWDLRKTDPGKAQTSIGGPGYATAKNPDTGAWEICIQGEKVEHDNPADYYNTVLKMAKKRAHVDAILTATAASDIFTQDLEDLKDNGVIGGGSVPTESTKKSVAQPQRKSTGGNGKQDESKTDAEKQVELARICTTIAETGRDVVTKDYKTYEFVSAEDIADTTLLAEGICKTISAFAGRDGPVKGKLATQLSGMPLTITIKKARDLEARLTAQAQPQGQQETLY